LPLASYLLAMRKGNSCLLFGKLVADHLVGTPVEV
jgi:hypothetical protein